MFSDLNELISRELHDISKEMNKQDNRATQNVLFAIQSLKATGNPDDYEKMERADIDGHDEYLCDDCRKIYYDWEDGGNEEMPLWCENCDPGAYDYFRYEFDLRPGVFFTQKAAQKHIDENHYHYNEPRIFGISSWRNEEMQEVQKFLSRLSSDKGKARDCYS